jgi:hypothetical protein
VCRHGLPSTVAPAAAALPNKNIKNNKRMMMTKSSSSFAISWNPCQHQQQQPGKSAREARQGHGRPKPFMSTSTSTTTEQEVLFWNQQPMDINNTHHSFIHSSGRDSI